MGRATPEGGDQEGWRRPWHRGPGGVEIPDLEAMTKAVIVSFYSANYGVSLDGLDALGATGDISLQERQKSSQSRIVFWRFAADALHHHLAIGALGVADTVALPVAKGLRHGSRQGEERTAIRPERHRVSTDRAYKPVQPGWSDHQTPWPRSPAWWPCSRASV